MNIHEHQAKAVLAEFGVAIPRGYPAFTVEEAVAAAEKLGGPVFVVKSQIHAGGTATPNSARTALAWCSWMFMRPWGRLATARPKPS